MSATQPYNGSTSKFCLAFDVGTSFSGISYCILRPGQAPSVYNVTRFFSQGHTVVAPKLPSVIYYDRDGNLRAVGADVLNPNIVHQANEESWIRITWFKLLFAPTTPGFEDILRSRAQDVSKTECEILADYIRYLYECARQYIYDSHPDGVFLWRSFERDIVFVLSHPNGWGGLQQMKMKSALKLAKLIQDDSDCERVTFVSEGEACLHYCMSEQNELSRNGVQTGDGVIILDAGGGTIDVSTYDVLNRSPASFEEMNVPETLLQGSEIVTFRMESLLRDIFKDRLVRDNIHNICETFDQTIKPKFQNDVDKYWIPMFHCSNNGIEFSGAEIASLFEPTISSVIDAIKKQRRGISLKIKTAFLLGGFAANPWLFAKLASRLRLMHIRLINVQFTHAVTEGSILVYLKNRVHFRIAKFTYGVECNREFEHNLSEHERRRARATVNPSGTPVLPGGYQMILRKGTKIAEGREFSRVFVQESTDPTKLNSVSCNITCYKGSTADPQWVDKELDQFKHLCTIHADTSRVPKLPLRTKSVYIQGADTRYFQQRFRVVLLFGMTELKAQIRWYENDNEKRFAENPTRVLGQFEHFFLMQESSPDCFRA